MNFERVSGEVDDGMSGHSGSLPAGYSWPSLGSEGGAVGSVAGNDVAVASEEEEEEEEQGEYGDEDSAMCTQSVGGVGFAGGGAPEPFLLHAGLKRAPGSLSVRGVHAAHAAPGAAVRPPLTLADAWNKRKRSKPRVPGASRLGVRARRNQVSEMIKSLSEHVPGSLPARSEGGAHVAQAESESARKRADAQPWKPSASRHGRACLLGGASSRPCAEEPSQADSSSIATGDTQWSADAGGDQGGSGRGAASGEERARRVEYEFLVERKTTPVCSGARPLGCCTLHTPPL